MQSKLTEKEFSVAMRYPQQDVFLSITPCAKKKIATKPINVFEIPQTTVVCDTNPDGNVFMSHYPLGFEDYPSIYEDVSYALRKLKTMVDACWELLWIERPLFVLGKGNKNRCLFYSNVLIHGMGMEARNNIFKCVTCGAKQTKTNKFKRCNGSCHKAYPVSFCTRKGVMVRGWYKIRYCSVRCQIKHWNNGHKYVCSRKEGYVWNH